jgi:hypothetical protein
VQKISDRKFAQLVPDLYFRLCEVQCPEVVFFFALSDVKEKKSPTIIEGMLVLSERYCNEFGVSSIGRSINNFVGWASEVC